MTNYEDVRTFHRKFDLPRGARVTGIRAAVGKDVAAERFRHLQEELDEYWRAMLSGDVAAEADALVDLVYVALGNAAMCNLPWTELWNAVHVANMAKSLGVDSRHKQGIVKPAGWTAPDLKQILAYVGADV